MNAATFDSHAQELLDLAQSIADAKRPGYTQGNEDVLKNFKDAAGLTGVTPSQAWAVYFYKHIAAIMSWAMDPNIAQAEALEGRFADALNYLKLGFGLFKEAQNVPPAIPVFDFINAGTAYRIQEMERHVARMERLQVDPVPFLDRLEAGIQDILVSHGITDEASLGTPLGTDADRQEVALQLAGLIAPSGTPGFADVQPLPLTAAPTTEGDPADPSAH